MDYKGNPKIREIMQHTDEIIDAGWKALRLARQKQGVHLTEKEIFFSGAGYLFDAIIHAMSPESEPTPEDMELMTKLHAELTKFHEGFNRKFQ